MSREEHAPQARTTSELSPSNSDLRVDGRRGTARTTVQQMTDAQLDRLSKRDIRALVHELDVHQVELEMQNEELRQAHISLEESRTKYIDLYDFAPVGYLTIDQNGTILEVNLTASSMLGMEREFLKGWSLVALVHKDDLELFHRHSTAIIETLAPQFYELRLKRKDGSHFYAALSCSISNESDGGINHVRIAISDLTQRKQAEEQLKDSEERLQLALMSTDQGLFDLNVRTGEITVSDQYALMLGYDPSGFRETHQTWIGRLHPDDKDRVSAYHRAYLHGDLKRYRVEFRLRTRAGTWKWILSVGKIVERDAEGNPVRMLGTHTDITEQRRLEEESLKLARLESVGQLAGGLAHDFNNLLTTILGNVSLAKMYVQDAEIPHTGEDVAEILTEAEKASIRARDLTHQLLTFSKGGAPIKKTASIADLIRESSAFALRGSNVRCDLAIPGNLWSADVDPGQINQVIHNVMVNALQAMPEGGIIRVACENTVLGKSDARSLEQGRYIQVTIMDQGPGIPEELLPRIFEPYFTTKPQGTGLGLATAYSIIARHHGLITATSTVGEGATFTIFLHASDQKPPAPRAVSKRIIHGQGKILVMDDEDTIRQLAAQMLSSLGYVAEIAKDGAEAIDLYKAALESSAPFDAVIMDLTIPGGMGGKEAIQELRNIDPDVLAIVSSGYSTDPIMSEYAEYGFCGVMPKPYRVKELSQLLHDLLAKDRRGT